MTTVTDEFVWLRSPDNGLEWQCPVGAVGAWTARGWVTCDPPVEPDPTQSDGPVEPETPAEMAPDEPADEPAEDPTSAAEPAADLQEGAE